MRFVLKQTLNSIIIYGTSSFATHRHMTMANETNRGIPVDKRDRHGNLTITASQYSQLLAAVSPVRQSVRVRVPSAVFVFCCAVSLSAQRAPTLFDIGYVDEPSFLARWSDIWLFYTSAPRDFSVQMFSITAVHTAFQNAQITDDDVDVKHYVLAYQELCK